MNTNLQLAAEPSSRTRPVRPGFLAKSVVARLSQIEAGELVLHDGTERRHVVGKQSGPKAELHVHDQRFWSALALRGSVGAGEAYARGWWSSPAPVEVIRLMVRNIDTLDTLESGFARLSKPFLAAFHRLRDNTARGSRDNIAAHYDLSNEFFELFLDPTMTYSCGVFESETATLEDASRAKIERLCQKLELSATDRLIEIGTGWGGFAIHAAKHYGCHVTTTISKRQFAFAAERIAAEGLGDRITLLQEDYRDLPALCEREGWAPFDKLVSVEMIEAVGHRYFDAFFRTCGQLLKPDGRMALQAITIADQRYEAAKNSVDFIQRYIFPGSCIPSVTALTSAATRASDLRLVALEDIGAHYVPTLMAWRKNLRANWDAAKGLGLDETFLRLFEFYFLYCEGGFAERHISGAHLILDRPQRRPAL